MGTRLEITGGHQTCRGKECRSSLGTWHPLEKGHLAGRQAACRAVPDICTYHMATHLQVILQGTKLYQTFSSLNKQIFFTMTWNAASIFRIWAFLELCIPSPGCCPPRILACVHADTPAHASTLCSPALQSVSLGHPLGPDVHTSGPATLRRMDWTDNFRVLGPQGWGSRSRGIGAMGTH